MIDAVKNLLNSKKDLVEAKRKVRQETDEKVLEEYILMANNNTKIINKIILEAAGLGYIML